MISRCFDFSKLKYLIKKVTVALVNIGNNNNRVWKHNRGFQTYGDNSPLCIVLQISENEERKIQLSGDERKILEKLSEGCRISYVRDQSSSICFARLFGDNENSIQDDVVLKLLPHLLRKGVVEIHDEKNIDISSSGKRIIQWLDLNGK